MWKSVGFNGYQVNRNGDVKNSFGIILKPHFNKQGCKFVQLRKNRIPKNLTVKKLIEIYFEAINKLPIKDPHLAKYPENSFLSNLNPPKQNNYSDNEVLFHLEIKASKIT